MRVQGSVIAATRRVAGSLPTIAVQKCRVCGGLRWVLCFAIGDTLERGELETPRNLELALIWAYDLSVPMDIGST